MDTNKHECCREQRYPCRSFAERALPLRVRRTFTDGHRCTQMHTDAHRCTQIEGTRVVGAKAPPSIICVDLCSSVMSNPPFPPTSAHQRRSDAPELGEWQHSCPFVSIRGS